MNNNNHMCDIIQNRQTTVNYPLSLLSSPYLFSSLLLRFMHTDQVQAWTLNLSYIHKPLKYSYAFRFGVVLHCNPDTFTLSEKSTMLKLCFKFFSQWIANISVLIILLVLEAGIKQLTDKNRSVVWKSLVDFSFSKSDTSETFSIKDFHLSFPWEYISLYSLSMLGSSYSCWIFFFPVT